MNNGTGIQYYSLDLESNGLKVNYHTVTEIGIIRNFDRVQLWRNIRCETPERSSVDALNVTKKTLADLDKGLSRYEVVAECNKFFNEDKLTPAHRCIVGHNIFNFDKRFLFALWESVGEEFPAELWADTIPMIRAYAKQIGLIKPKVNLHAACDIAGIKKLSGSHNAQVDSRNSYLLWTDLINNKKIDHLPFIKQAKHILSPSTEEQALDPDLLDL